jgi:hypothetical protein
MSLGVRPDKCLPGRLYILYPDSLKKKKKKKNTSQGSLLCSGSSGIKYAAPRGLILALWVWVMDRPDVGVGVESE